jgi:hypothetical protein
MKGHGSIYHHIFLIPAAAAFIAVFGAVVMVLWNALLPRIAGLPSVNFWEASGILILARILFGGLGGAGIHHGHKNLFKEKWLHMNDEERKNFVTKFHGFRHCHGASAGEENRSGSPSTDQNEE